MIQLLIISMMFPDNYDNHGLVIPADVSEQGSSNLLVPEIGHAIVRAVPRAELDMGEISSQIWEISRPLDGLADAIQKALKLEPDCIVLAKQDEDQKRPLTTPYLTEAKIFGRDDERDKIIEVLTGDACRNLTLSVLPIFGKGGIGKTTLVQYVCSDSRIQTYFDITIWICVSLNFDIARITKQMLECVTGTDQGGGANLDHLQEMLQGELKDSRVLLVLDDMWDVKEKNEWARLIAPLSADKKGKGSVVLVTTRNRLVADTIYTLPQIELNPLKEEDFWNCFRSYAFGKEKGDKKLHDIGREIAKRLKGFPLAAKSVGGLLRKNVSSERWKRILDNKAWVSHQDEDGIVAILKISYDYLPLHLRRCFSYCSLFPKGYLIYAEDLVYLWISQGFVYSASDNRRLEEVGSEYLDDLVNLGFFDKVAKERTDIHYLIHDLMHDLARDVSSKDCFTMDCPQLQPVPSTIRHLSIIATAQYSEFEKDMIELNRWQTKKLKSLMIFGSLGTTFVTCFQSVSDMLRNLRTLRLSGVEDDGDILSSFGHCIHLRYLRATKQEYDKQNPWLVRYDRHFPKELCRLYRLQFLNVGVNCYLSNLAKSFSNLVNLRHFICHEENHSQISEVGKLASLQELHQFKVRNDPNFHITQLGSLFELDSLCIFGLENLETKEEANSARLLDREQLRILRLSWDASGMSDNTDIDKEILEGLQPHVSLNHLRISGYRSVAPPAWLGEASALIHLQSIYLEDCKHLRTLPPFVLLKCLKKLHLSRICGTAEVLTHSLEELVINEVDDIERWVVSDEHFLLASELQVLEIKGCPKLKDHPLPCNLSAQTVFPLLNHFIIHNCPLLMPLPPLPLGPKVMRMAIINVGSPSYQCLQYNQFKSVPYYKTLLLDGKDKLRTPDGLLALQNLGALYEVSFVGCSNLTWFSWVEAFQQLKMLKKLNFEDCSNLLSIPAAPEDQDYRNSHQLPCVEKLAIVSCCIRGNQLAHLLSLLPSLSCLELEDCPRAEDDECMLLIPPGPLTSLKEICIENCVNLSCGSSEGLKQLISLEKLRIGFKFISSLMPDEMEEDGHSLGQSILLPSSLKELVLDSVNHKLLSLSSLTSLKNLGITDSPDLETLDLQSCTELEEIDLHECGALSSVQGLHTCIHLRSIEVFDSLLFWSAWSHALQELERVDHDLFPQLERIWTDDLSLLTTASCKYLMSLKRLGFYACEDDGHDNSTIDEPNVDEPNEAFLFLTSLEELEFNSYNKFDSLPAALHLPSVKKLAIKSCKSIKSLEKLGLPPSLEELHISGCGSLQSLPSKLNYLPSLKKLEIISCPCILSLQEQRLPASLEELVIESCQNLLSLPDETHHLSSLNKLEIKSCPGIKSLPESGLPPALREFWVWDCSEELKRQCKNIRNIRRMSQMTELFPTEMEIENA